VRGPGMRSVLRLLKIARLDGEARSRQDEVELVQGVLAGKVELPGVESSD